MTRFLVRLPLCGLAALMVLTTTAASAQAQYGYYPPGYYPNGIYGRGYGYGTGMGNYLQGVATVQDAYGNLALQSEQARILREKADQEKLVTRRQTFDQLKYERDNTPPVVANMEKTASLKLRRMLTVPYPGEITNGDALNTLLPYLTQLAHTGYQGGPPVPLNQQMLKQLNVSSGVAATGAGLLKDGGKLNWPFALRGPMQEELDPLLEKAVGLAAQNKMTPPLYKQITTTIEAINEDLRKQFHREDIDGAAFLEGQHFVESLKGSVALLKSPNASKYFNGTYAARGVTVDELVVNMTSQGLKFAPAQPGNEAAYFSLYSSFQQYASASQCLDDSSFRLRTPPTRQGPIHSNQF